MVPFSHEELNACRRLVQLALEEDLGQAGDLTSCAIIPPDHCGRAAFVARAPGVLAGLPAAELVFAALDPSSALESLVSDGALLQKGDRIATISGKLRTILAGERAALNFLQRLSGIATLTRRFVDAVAGLPCKILDTRKTTPGWRLLEKYAVRQGGGANHRMGLFDGILIKDNHLAAMPPIPSPVRKALDLAVRQVGCELSIEIEVDNLEQFDEAASTCEADIILLDNMNLEQLREAVKRNKAWVAPPLLEASGGVTLDTVRAIAETGVDRISVGALTHSAVALDIALDYDK